MRPSQSGPLAKLIAHPCFRAFSPLLCCQPTKIFMLTHWRPATFGDFQGKKTGTHVALRGNFSGPVSATDPVKVPKYVESLVACTRKNFFCLGIADFL